MKKFKIRKLIMLGILAFPITLITSCDSWEFKPVKNPEFNNDDDSSDSSDNKDNDTNNGGGDDSDEDTGGGSDTTPKEEEETVVDLIKKTDTSQKTELFLQSIEINEEHPITTSEDLKGTLGIDITIPDDYSVKVTKMLHSNKIKFVVQKNGDDEKRTFIREIVNFEPDTSYEKLLKDAVTKLKTMDFASITKEEFQLKSTEITGGEIKTDFTDEDISDQIKQEMLNKLGIVVYSFVSSSLQNITGFKKMEVKKEYDSDYINISLTASPTQDKIIPGENDYYTMAIKQKIIQFKPKPTDPVEKLKVLKNMIDDSVPFVKTNLTDATLKYQQIDDKSFWDIKTSLFGGLEINNLIGKYATENDILLRIDKPSGSNQMTFKMKDLNSSETETTSFDIYGSYRVFRSVISKRQNSKMLLNTDWNIIYAFGVGGWMTIRSMDDGKYPTGWSKPIDVFGERSSSPKSDFWPMNTSLFYNDDGTNTIAFPGMFFENDSEGDHFTTKTLNSSLGIVQTKYITYAQKGNDIYEYVSQFALPTKNKNEILLVVNKYDNRGYKGQPKTHPSDQWFVSIFNRTTKKGSAFKALMRGIIGEVMLWKDAPEDGYLIRNWNLNKQTQIVPMDKDFKLITGSSDSRWNTSGAIVTWRSSDLIKAKSGDNGFWLSGVNGELIYISEKGIPDQNSLIHTGKKITSMVLDNDGNGLFVVGDGGYFAHYVLESPDTGIKYLKKDWEKNILELHRIDQIKKDDNGFLYIIGNSRANDVAIEKISPDGLHDMWE